MGGYPCPIRQECILLLNFNRGLFSLPCRVLVTVFCYEYDEFVVCSDISDDLFIVYEFCVSQPGCLATVIKTTGSLTAKLPLINYHHAEERNIPVMS